jgi:uncharacterized protein
MINFSKFIRDPIYGFIGLTQDELQLLDTSVVQRLRRIKQLGNTHLIYPSANHTRFEHSLGVMHVATRMAKRLELNEAEIINIRYAALMHDVGHGPMSHVFESALENSGLKISHENVTHKIISESEEVVEALGEHKAEVLSLFNEDNDTVNAKIISGNIDADKLDYLRRDSYHIGVEYGNFDLERILHTINKKVERDRSDLTVFEKGKEAVENYRLARYLMYTQVYFHHARVIADKMFERAVSIAVRDGILNKDLFKLDNDGFLKYYLSLDDNRLFQKILSNEKTNAYTLIDDLENRRMMKAGYEINTKDIENAGLRHKLASGKYFEKIEKNIAQECHCENDFIISYLIEIDNPLYKSSNEFYKADKTPILFENETTRKLIDIDEVTQFEIKKNSPIKFYIIGPNQCRRRIAEASHHLSDYL